MDYVKVNVAKTTGTQPGKGLQIRDSITLIDVNDIATLPAHDGKGVLITDSIAMVGAAKGITLYLSQDTAEMTSNSEGDTDNEGFMPSIKFKHPGNSLAVREFKANWIGRKCIVIMKHCENGKKDLIGTLCNPCKMQVNLSANKDATNNEFTFAQMMRGNDIAEYQGNETYV